jgi:hypothetical protein
MKFNDFLNIDLEDNDKIIDYYLNYLQNLSNEDFPFEEQLKLRGVGTKFLDSIGRKNVVTTEKKNQYIALIGNLEDDYKRNRQVENLSILFRLLKIKSKKRSLIKLQDSYGELYSNTLSLINDLLRYQRYNSDDLRVNDFFKPEISNKSKVKELIKEAIELIKEDYSLKEKTKKSIIEYLEIALNELDREYVNWTKFIGRIKETIIVLGALGTFTGEFVSPLFNAREKLENATTVIQNTSINVNYNVISDTFNIQNIHQISSIKNLIALPSNDNENGDSIKSDNENHLDESF